MPDTSSLNKQTQTQSREAQDRTGGAVCEAVHAGSKWRPQSHRGAGITAIRQGVPGALALVALPALPTTLLVFGTVGAGWRFGLRSFLTVRHLRIRSYYLMPTSSLSRWAKRGCLWLVLYCVLFGQTRVSLNRQAQGVDFTTFPSTKPIRMGTTLPPTCGQGEFFFNLATPAGQNLYACYSSNNWVLMGGGGTVTALPVQTGSAGVLLTNGTTAAWGNLPTGGSGALDCATIPGSCDIPTAVVPRLASANNFTGVNKFSLLQLTTYTVAQLPPCTPSFEGQMEGVTDGLNVTYLGVIGGGGTTHVPVYCNGSLWVAH